MRQNGALPDAYPSQEGIAGVRVTAFNNGAEFSQLGDVTFTTKSGANRYHGSFFEYFQNSALDASPYGFSGKALKNFNTFGGSFSGPVVIPHFYNGRDRTFFFADYEGNRRTLFGGFDINTVTLVESGPWLTPSISPSFDQSNTNVQNRGAFLRPDVVSNDFTKGRSRAQYFNLAAFAPTPVNAGRFGNAGVGILEGPERRR